jgi:pyridoxine 5-phosphate synthase
VRELGRTLRVPLNLEMAATSAMVAQALRFKPREACLVPENREEITTEGGLNVIDDMKRLRKVVRQLHGAKIIVSAFIDPDIGQIEAAHHCGAQVVELHTGAYANCTTVRTRNSELSRQARAAAHAHALGLQVNAGHGLNYTNVREYLEDVPHLHTLNIGHAIVSRAVLVGLDRAVAEMVSLLGTHECTLAGD